MCKRSPSMNGNIYIYAFRLIRHRGVIKIPHDNDKDSGNGKRNQLKFMKQQSSRGLYQIALICAMKELRSTVNCTLSLRHIVVTSRSVSWMCNSILTSFTVIAHSRQLSTHASVFEKPNHNFISFIIVRYITSEYRNIVESRNCQ